MLPMHIFTISYSNPDYRHDVRQNGGRFSALFYEVCNRLVVVAFVILVRGKQHGCSSHRCLHYQIRRIVSRYLRTYAPNVEHTKINVVQSVIIGALGKQRSIGSVGYSQSYFIDPGLRKVFEHLGLRKILEERPDWCRLSVAHCSLLLQEAVSIQLWQLTGFCGEIPAHVSKDGEEKGREGNPGVFLRYHVAAALDVDGVR
mmetsp:Transcript_11662/g.24636  ORF Transcript_11662/g.24636 Transcript_11662/m.24636 type:complete len:201 (-) Transcript_11662:1550-2152(-)